MDIFKIWTENKYEKEYKEGLDKATELFIKQKDSINQIKDSEGYKVIKSWLRMRREMNMNLVMQSGKSQDKAKGKYEESNDLLAFLENLEERI